MIGFIYIMIGLIFLAIGFGFGIMSAFSYNETGVIMAIVLQICGGVLIWSGRRINDRELNKAVWRL